MELTATIPALLRQQAADHGAEIIPRKKDHGIWKATSWSELQQRVRAIGQGLRESGLAPDQTVAILSDTRPELVFVDLAILSCGAASVALHPEEEGPRVAEILRETGVSIAVVEGEEQLDKLLGVRGECPALRLIVIIEKKGLRDFHDPHCTGLDDLIAQGASRTDWQNVADAITADRAAAILVPRFGPGRTMTHGDIMRLTQETGQTLGVLAGDERLAVLPMCDPTERVFGLYLALKYRIVSNYLENPETATENLREVKPTILGADNEAWTRLHARISGLSRSATGIQRALYQWAIAAGAAGGLMGSLADFLVLPAVRAELGFGRLRVAYVGDGAVTGEVARWASALGVTVKHINML